MDVEIRSKIIKFIKLNGSATSRQVAEHLGIDKNQASHIMAKLQHRWRDLESLGMDGQSRIYGIRRDI